MVCLTENIFQHKTKHIESGSGIEVATGGVP